MTGVMTGVMVWGFVLAVGLPLAVVLAAFFDDGGPGAAA